MTVPLPRRGADEREARKVEPYRLGGGALAEHDVDREVLHSRVENLFHRAGQAVDLVDEEDVARLQVGEDGGEVPGSFQRRARCDSDGASHLAGNYPRQGRLSETGRPRKEDVIQRTALGSGGVDRYPHPLFDLLLADEVLQRMGAEACLHLIGGGGAEEAVLTHGGPVPGLAELL